MSNNYQVVPTVQPNQQEYEYQKSGLGRIVGGFIVGSGVTVLAQLPNSYVSSEIGSIMTNLDNNLTKDEFVSASEGCKKIMAKSGLSDKGVSQIFANSQNRKEITDILAKEFKRDAWFLPEKIRNFLVEIKVAQVESGINAFYAPYSKKIIMPNKQLSLAGFHEMGHAANHNLSVFGKMLQKVRPLSILGLPIALLAFKPKKAPNEKPEGTFGKVTDFVKKNAGILTFAAFTPMLLEEGLATLKGNKYAKEVLSSELVKKVAKHNKFGFISYLGVALAASIGITLGREAYDGITEPKLVVKRNKITK